MSEFNILMSDQEEEEFWEKLEDEREKNSIPHNSFFQNIRGQRPNEHIESADNRRAADAYIPNF